MFNQIRVSIITLGATTEAALGLLKGAWFQSSKLDTRSSEKLLADTVTGDEVSCVAAISAISQNTHIKLAISRSHY